MTYFQQNAFGWYIMVIKDKKKAELIDKILNDYENDLKFAELKIKKKKIIDVSEKVTKGLDKKVNKK